MSDTKTETSWKALNSYHYYDGPTIFTALRKDTEGYPDVFLFRWAGGKDADRLYVSDIHDKMRTPLYVYESDIDFEDMQ